MLKMCGRLKGLIFYKDLIFPQSRKSAEIRAQFYFSSVYRPCFTKTIILALPPNFPFRKAVFLMPRRNITSTYRRHA
jgi:hypothetical protein